MNKRIIIVENCAKCPYKRYVSELGGFICGLLYNEKRRIMGCYNKDESHEECPLDKL